MIKEGYLPSIASRTEILQLSGAKSFQMLRVRFFSGSCHPKTITTDSPRSKQQIRGNLQSLLFPGINLRGFVLPDGKIIQGNAALSRRSRTDGLFQPFHMCGFQQCQGERHFGAEICRGDGVIGQGIGQCPLPKLIQIIRNYLPASNRMN